MVVHLYFTLNYFKRTNLYYFNLKTINILLELILYVKEETQKNGKYRKKYY